jgi:phosphoacetylglucosamine mutase
VNPTEQDDVRASVITISQDGSKLTWSQTQNTFVPYNVRSNTATTTTTTSIGANMNLQLDRTNLETILSTKVPYNETIHKSYYPYGTAGFREYATELHPIMIRIGLAMALLSHHYMRLQTDTDDHSSHDDDDTARVVLPSVHFGIMITASHNTYEYNGVKCIHMDGGMITPDGEAFVTTIVNARNIDTLLQYIQEQLPLLSVDSSISATASMTKQQRYLAPTIHIGYDTRSHSVEFANLVREGIQLLLSRSAEATTPACHIQNHHIVTTPMLHHIVKHNNGLIGYYHHLPSIISTHPSTNGYYHILVHAYQSLLLTKVTDITSTTTTQGKRVLHVDCACGVAYEHLTAILNTLTPSNTNESPSISTATTTTIVAHNPPSETEAQLLNHQCGSEYVQKQQCSCIWYDDANNNDDSNDRSYCASVDGDGDRIVFFATSSSSSKEDTNQFILLDGDYIACLLCTFIQNEIQILQSYMNQRNTTPQRPVPTPIRFGVVQTAYANGASTQYLKKNQIPVIMAKTGVKYVHAAAHDNYDIGIYFESNGHGTVIFNDAYYRYLHEIEEWLYPASSHDDNECMTPTRPNPSAYCAYQRLKILPNLINQAVGDAISDLLLIDAILYIKEWTLHDWYTSLYSNLPSRQMKVKVLDRTIIRTNDNETQCLSPTTVQPALDALMEQHAAVQARIFIRPSGTEDVVRVYAEATTQEIADALAQKAIAIVQEFCGGI